MIYRRTAILKREGYLYLGRNRWLRLKPDLLRDGYYPGEIEEPYRAAAFVWHEIEVETPGASDPSVLPGV